MDIESIENVLSLHTADRLLDARILSFDLPLLVEKIKQEDTWKMGDRNTITLLKTLNMRIVLIALHQQTEMNFQQSGNLISIQVIEGKMNFQTEKQSINLKQGSLLTIHEDIKQVLIAIEESIFLLTIVTYPPISI